ncbi:hypothetical protein ElyMa_004457200 [Elysia marginata]|uniref:Uncharacterized protein n=1 Tax=Elysia marginata TaxID=1093978 RepID=A0AAV4HIS2_9GAST|nr:hypothetical protein ElyMa_004457200 [Elysia marginata]
MSSSIRVAHMPTPNTTLSTPEPEPQAEVSSPLDTTEPEENISLAGNCDLTTTPRMKRSSKCIDEYGWIHCDTCGTWLAEMDTAHFRKAIASCGFDVLKNVYTK